MIRRIFLAHHANPSYRVALKRLLVLEFGAQAIEPETTFLRVLGAGPDHANDLIPPADRRSALARRLIVGDGRQHQGSQPTSCYPPASIVWLLSAKDEEVREQLALAEGAKIPVAVFDQEAQDALFAAGLAALLALKPGRLVASEQPPEDGPFRSAAGCIYAWVNGAEAKLGTRAIPLPTPDSGSQGGGGGAFRWAKAMETCGLKIAAAEAIFRVARIDERWTDRTEDVLRLIYGEGKGYIDAAKASGLSGAMAAWRVHRGAEAAIRWAMAGKRAGACGAGAEEKA